jgi:uncharacterized membrane protein YjdF
MKRAFLALVAIFAVNAVGLYYGWYLEHFWFDMLLHFLGGFFIAMLMAGYLKEHFGGSKLKNILVILGATAFIGVIWEFTEYIANQTLTEPTYKYFGIRAYFMGDLDDTVNDLMMDILGGTLLSSLHLLRRRDTH